ncbi:MAG: hypothetical protein HY842_13080 [Bacteroidetes bacterium]|nr:hypothetical protein [Bacteroidota bacterium]
MLSFDENGNLIPHEIIETTWDDFTYTFSEGFEKKRRRKHLLANYQLYLDDIKRHFETPFYQWVNGSFVTQKQHPRDIDMVTFLPYDLIVKKAIFVDQLRKTSKSLYKIDGFFAPTANWNHRFFESTLREAERWKTLFGTSREGHPKGIIRLNFMP